MRLSMPLPPVAPAGKPRCFTRDRRDDGETLVFLDQLLTLGVLVVAGNNKLSRVRAHRLVLLSGEADLADAAFIATLAPKRTHPRGGSSAACHRLVVLAGARLRR
jgi:hypothetical protein